MKQTGVKKRVFLLNKPVRNLENIIYLCLTSLPSNLDSRVFKSKEFLFLILRVWTLWHSLVYTIKTNAVIAVFVFIVNIAFVFVTDRPQYETLRTLSTDVLNSAGFFHLSGMH
jgi:hypothetical protein